MKKIIKILEEIKDFQMQHVQLARTTKIYKLAEKAQKRVLNIGGVVNMACKYKKTCGHYPCNLDECPEYKQA